MCSLGRGGGDTIGIPDYISDDCLLQKPMQAHFERIRPQSACDDPAEHRRLQRPRKPPPPRSAVESNNRVASAAIHGNTVGGCRFRATEKRHSRDEMATSKSGHRSTWGTRLSPAGDKRRGATGFTWSTIETGTPSMGKIVRRYFGDLNLNCLQRTERTMSRKHIFKAAVLCLGTQAAAKKFA